MKPWFALLCCAALSAQADVLIDVRSADEFAQEHIAGAYLLPVQEIAAISAQVPDKNETIYLLGNAFAKKIKRGIIFFKRLSNTVSCNSLIDATNHSL